MRVQQEGRKDYGSHPACGGRGGRQVFGRLIDGLGPLDFPIRDNSEAEGDYAARRSDEAQVEADRYAS